MTPVRVEQGEGPVILAFPHVGLEMPANLRARLNSEGRLLRDTDWHVDRLYDGLLPDATRVYATQSRYVIDLNRDPEGRSLYPGQSTTELVPERTFDNEPIWEHAPDDAHLRFALEAVHRPYHAALSAEIARIRAKHGIVVLFDCHSIRSEIPWLFKGILPDLNIGTDGGCTAAPELEAVVVEGARASGRSFVLNGRFRGGWTTRHYARPESGVHCVQMELAQSTYLAQEKPPFAYDPEKAAALRETLVRILSQLAATALRLVRK